MKLKSLLLSVAGLLLGSQLHAAPVLGADIIVASDGNVVATFVGQTAGYDNELYLFAPNFQFAFHNHINNPGDTVDLGFFTAGTLLKFGIWVPAEGMVFYSGDGSDNPDGLAHAIVDDNYFGQTLVGFEDLYGGGDRDFDDTLFSFTNVRSSVPDSGSTALLLVAGFGGLAALRRRR